MPLRHLIVLIVNAHPSAEAPIPSQEPDVIDVTHFKRPASHCSNDGAVSTRRRRPGPLAKPHHRLAPSRDPSRTMPYSRCQTATCIPPDEPAFMENTKQIFADEQHHPHSRELLLTGSGGARRDRTDDLMLAKHALSQLSYGPRSRELLKVRFRRHPEPKMVGLGRLERPTSPLSGVRSNHLSYRPVDRAAPYGASLQRQACPRRKRNEDGEVPQMPAQGVATAGQLMSLRNPIETG